MHLFSAPARPPAFRTNFHHRDNRSTANKGAAKLGRKGCRTRRGSVRKQTLRHTAYLHSWNECLHYSSSCNVTVKTNAHPRKRERTVSIGVSESRDLCCQSYTCTHRTRSYVPTEKVALLQLTVKLKGKQTRRGANHFSGLRKTARVNAEIAPERNSRDIRKEDQQTPWQLTLATPTENEQNAPGAAPSCNTRLDFTSKRLHSRRSRNS